MRDFPIPHPLILGSNLLRSGQSGLSVAFDLPTQLGLDSDDPLWESGKSRGSH